MFTGDRITIRSDVEKTVKSVFLFENFPNGEELEDIIAEVWEWEFDILQYSGEFVNIFDPYARFEEKNIPIQTEKETLYSEDEKKELESISQAVEQELKEAEEIFDRVFVYNCMRGLRVESYYVPDGKNQLNSTRMLFTECWAINCREIGYSLELANNSSGIYIRLFRFMQMVFEGIREISVLLVVRRFRKNLRCEPKIVIIWDFAPFFILM